MSSPKPEPFQDETGEIERVIKRYMYVCREHTGRTTNKNSVHNMCKYTYMYVHVDIRI